jgi:hypothetical protein
MKKTSLAIGSILLIILLALFVLLRSCDKRIDNTANSSILAPGVVEKVVINPGTHKLSIITSRGTQELFLPDRPSSIEIEKNGKAVITSRQWGTELKPFIGFQFSNVGRLAFGVDGLYYKRLDLGVGAAWQIGTTHAPVGLCKLSYTVWSNTQAGITYDTGSRVGGIITVRF